MEASADTQILGALLQPHRWGMLPQYSEREVCDALLTVVRSPAGQVLVTQLIVTYLLAHPVDMRDVGKQDLVRELLDLLQRGLLARSDTTGPAEVPRTYGNLEEEADG